MLPQKLLSQDYNAQSAESHKPPNENDEIQEALGYQKNAVGGVLGRREDELNVATPEASIVEEANGDDESTDGLVQNNDREFDRDVLNFNQDELSPEDEQVKQLELELRDFIFKQYPGAVDDLSSANIVRELNSVEIAFKNDADEMVLVFQIEFVSDCTRILTSEIAYDEFEQNHGYCCFTC